LLGPEGVCGEGLGLAEGGQGGVGPDDVVGAVEEGVVALVGDLAWGGLVRDMDMGMGMGRYVRPRLWYRILSPRRCASLGRGGPARGL
jgi:hypothetical protein